MHRRTFRCGPYHVGLCCSGEVRAVASARGGDMPIRTAWRRSVCITSRRAWTQRCGVVAESRSRSFSILPVLIGLSRRRATTILREDPRDPRSSLRSPAISASIRVFLAAGSQCDSCVPAANARGESTTALVTALSGPLLDAPSEFPLVSGGRCVAQGVPDSQQKRGALFCAPGSWRAPDPATASKPEE